MDIFLLSTNLLVNVSFHIIDTYWYIFPVCFVVYSSHVLHTCICSITGALMIMIVFCVSAEPDTYWARILSDLVKTAEFVCVCVFYAPPLIGWGNKRCFCLKFDVCLSRTSGLTREQRFRKTKIGTEVAHVTRDSDTTFRFKRSTVKVTRPLYSARP